MLRPPLINLLLSRCIAQAEGLAVLGRQPLLSHPALKLCQAAETQIQEKIKAVSLSLCSLLLNTHSPEAEKCQPCSLLQSRASSQPMFNLNLCLLSLLLRALAHYITHILPHPLHHGLEHLQSSFFYFCFISSSIQATQIHEI